MTWRIDHVRTQNTGSLLCKLTSFFNDGCLSGAYGGVGGYCCLREGTGVMW